MVHEKGVGRSPVVPRPYLYGPWVSVDTIDYNSLGVVRHTLEAVHEESEYIHRVLLMSKSSVDFSDVIPLKRPIFLSGRTSRHTDDPGDPIRCDGREGVPMRGPSSPGFLTGSLTRNGSCERNDGGR